jgi:hypothetical protein
MVTLRNWYDRLSRFVKHACIIGNMNASSQLLFRQHAPYYLSLEISEDSFDTTNFNGSWSVSSQHEVACCNEQPISDANIRLTAFAASTIHKYFL